MKFSIKDFYSKYDRIRCFLRIWLHLLEKSLMQNFIFWVVKVIFLKILEVMTHCTLNFSRILVDNTTYKVSIFSPNAVKYGPETLRIRTLFTQCNPISCYLFFSFSNEERKLKSIKTKNHLYCNINEIFH